jgi:hypothetical protein
MKSARNSRMSRRFFIKATTGGAAAVIIGNVARIPGVFESVAWAQPGAGVDLIVREALVEMVDLVQVYHWVWEVDPTNLHCPFAPSPNLTVPGPSLPGRTICAVEGEAVTINVTNTLDEDHAFALVSGPSLEAGQNPAVVTTDFGAETDEGGVIVPGTLMAPVAPGGTGTVTFAAPPAGTYIYLDPLNAPVNRALGLNGMFISSPAAGNTPYSAPTPAVQQLFNDLGATAHFPGQPWRVERTWLWNFFSIDPKFNLRVERGETLDPAEFRAGQEPRYFMISGKTGFFSAHDPFIFPFGFQGNPALIRNVNTGMATHSPHLHGNHPYIIAINNTVQANVVHLDSWTMRPLAVTDVLHPFVQPPDIPPAAWPPVQEQFPLLYPMHCHTEQSQTANGGNYPQGLVTDWDLLGPLGEVAGGPETFEGDSHNMHMPMQP